MSYDVNVGPEAFNYTYNVSRLFHDHMEGGLSSINDMTGRAAGDFIAAGLEKIERTQRSLWVDGAIGEPEFCARYDATNGWGSTVGAILFLSLIMAACYRHPRSRVRVS